MSCRDGKVAVINTNFFVKKENNSSNFFAYNYNNILQINQKYFFVESERSSTSSEDRSNNDIEHANINIFNICNYGYNMQVEI